MKVVDIKQLSPAIKVDPECDCTDIIACFEDGSKGVYEVCTASYLPEYMKENGMDYITTDCPLIIVDKLVHGTLMKAIKSRCE